MKTPLDASLQAHPQVQAILEMGYDIVYQLPPDVPAIDFTVYYEGRVAASASVRIEPDEHHLKMLTVTVEMPHRRKGIATMLYVCAEQMTGYVFVPTPVRSGEGKKLWAQPNRPFGIEESPPMNSEALLPKRIMGDVFWRFDGEPFQTREAFDTAIREYQQRNWDKEWWKPEEVMLPVPKILIQPDASLFGVEDEPEPIEVHAQNGTGLTAGELLFAAHNAFVAVLRDRDHRYYEGFRHREEQDREQIPFYEISLGS